MKRQLLLFATLLAVGCTQQPEKPHQAPSLDLFADGIHHWYLVHEVGSCDRYAEDDFRSIAENLLAFQNEDGGWPKNIDWLGKLDADSVMQTKSKREGRSTFDNRNIYPQIAYLSEVYALTGEKRYREAARRAIAYTLDNQFPNGSWIGWEDDAIAFNDGIIDGILNTWRDILKGEIAHYKWIDKKTRRRIQASWDAGLRIILDTQFTQNGKKSVWAQQHDQQTLVPVKARSYELPSLTAQESADIVLFLMSIESPSEEVITAVKSAVAWFEQTKIEGKKVVTIPMPEGNPEDRSIKADRRLVDDPEAEPIWARFYELADNTPFLCNRDGIKVYSLDKVLPERRVGYSWYGTWGNKVLKAYPKWLERIEKR